MNVQSLGNSLMINAVPKYKNLEIIHEKFPIHTRQSLSMILYQIYRFSFVGLFLVYS